jgi:hypothetical protein
MVVSRLDPNSAAATHGPPHPTMIDRRFQDDDGTEWRAFAASAVVAHGRPGAVLAFRPASGEGHDEFRSGITFNSMDAAAFALRTLGEKDLRRRLALTLQAAGRP